MSVFIDDDPHWLADVKGVGPWPRIDSPLCRMCTTVKDEKIPLKEFDKQTPFFYGPNDALTVGVELEMVARNRQRNAPHNFRIDNPANWFTVKPDNSLPPGGMELTTLPLPWRVWSKQETWTGLCNLLLPHFEAANQPDAGLHVSVGLNNVPSPTLEGLEVFHWDDPECRNRFFGLMVRRIFAALPDDLKTRVFGRECNEYCGRDPAVDNAWFARRLYQSFTPAEFLFHLFDGQTTQGHALNTIAKTQLNDCEGKSVKGCVRHMAPLFARQVLRENIPANRCLEVNTLSTYRLEFRRGKATLDPVKMLRIIKTCMKVCNFALQIATFSSKLFNLQDLVERIETP